MNQNKKGHWVTMESQTLIINSIDTIFVKVIFIPLMCA